MRLLGPFAIPALNTTDDRVVAPNGTSIAVKVHNLSGSLLGIQIGTQMQWLPAFSVDVFTLNGEMTMHVTNKSVELATAIESIYLITVGDRVDGATAEDIFGSHYPVDMSRAAPVLGWTLVGSKGLAGGGTPDSLVTSAVPPNTKSLMILLEGSPTPAASYVTGNTTGVIYLRGSAALSQSEQIVTVNAQADTQYTISFSAGAGTTVLVFASDLALPTVTNSGQQISSDSLPVVIASDQSAVPSFALKYDGQGVANPAAGTRATVTLAANPTRSWIADIHKGSTVSGGTAGNSNLNLVNGTTGGTVITQDGLQVLVTANTADRAWTGPAAKFAGSANTAMTVEFAAAPPASASQRVSIGAYLQ